MIATLTLYTSLSGLVSFTLIWPFGFLWLGGFRCEAEARACAKRIAGVIGREINEA